jgi:hypothetical protein
MNNLYLYIQSRTFVFMTVHFLKTAAFFYFFLGERFNFCFLFDRQEGRRKSQLLSPEITL